MSSVLARDERLIDVFVEFSPAFKMLRNPIQRRTMAKLVTISQAARIAGVDASQLLARLNQAIGEGGTKAAPNLVQVEAAPKDEGAAPPPGLLETPAERIVDLDVRDDLREGREPLRRILETVKTVPEGSVFRLRATFEPVPLFTVLGRQGYANFSERLSQDDWRVWFYKDEAGARQARAASKGAAPTDDIEDDGDIVILDVRGLEPPEPMMRTLEALTALPRGKTLLQINQRVPQFLLPKIRERGFTWEVREQSKDLVRIFIRHQQ